MKINRARAIGTFVRVAVVLVKGHILGHIKHRFDAKCSCETIEKRILPLIPSILGSTVKVK